MEALLIHGWDPEVYSSNLADTMDRSVAWKKRSKFIDLLKLKYKVRYYNLPGFCERKGQKDIIDIDSITLDFNNYLMSHKKPGIIIGYSFGGVIALNHKVQMNNDIPTVLIAPALSRKYSFFSKVGSISKVLVPDILQEGLKHTYQLLFSKYYRSADETMRKSYDKIVRIDSSKLIGQANGMDILFIYGSKDTATPWTKVSRKIKRNKFDYVLIKDGTHNIGQSHPNEIIDAIDNFMGIK